VQRYKCERVSGVRSFERQGMLQYEYSMYVPEEVKTSLINAPIPLS
jgi:hypothetical protein